MVKVTLRLNTEGLAQLPEGELSNLAPTQNRPLIVPGNSRVLTNIPTCMYDFKSESSSWNYSIIESHLTYIQMCHLIKCIVV